MRLQPAQTVARRGDPLRQIRPDLSRWRLTGLCSHPCPRRHHPIGRHALAAALRPALAARGVPASIYVDNGSAFVDAWLLRACAKLGVRLVHSTPGRPQGRGKIERFFRTVREQFLVEVTDTASEDLAAAGVDDATALLEL